MKRFRSWRSDMDWRRVPGRSGRKSTSSARASASEIVIPVHEGGEVRAVLDIDSIQKDRFSEEDKAGLEALVRVIEEKVNWA